MRLNRFLARAGIASRRKSEVLIQKGAVQVNGDPVRDPGRSIAVGRDRVDVAGRQVVLPEACEYILLHKPAGCLVTRNDTHGRSTVFDRIGNLHPGTVSVGRLDQDTTGLLLLTDDGELAFRLMHPRFEIKKRYEVLVKGAPAPAKVDRLRRGITLEDGKTSPAQVRVRQRRRVGRAVETRLGICIHEGRKRQVKRMFEAIGHPAQTLERVEFAGLTLEGLRPGQWRRLRDREVRQLRSQVGLRSCLEIPGEPKV